MHKLQHVSFAHKNHCVQRAKPKNMNFTRVTRMGWTKARLQNTNQPRWTLFTIFHFLQSLPKWEEMENGKNCTFFAKKLTTRSFHHQNALLDDFRMNSHNIIGRNPSKVIPLLANQDLMPMLSVGRHIVPSSVLRIQKWYVDTLH